MTQMGNLIYSDIIFYSDVFSKGNVALLGATLFA